MNNRFERQSPNKIKQLETLHRISGKLLELQSPSTTEQEVINVLEDIMSYEYGAILLIDHEQRRLIPYALSKLDNQENFFNRDKAYILSQEIYLDRGITGWVARHGISICSGDIQNDPRYIGIRKDINSELCVPLILEDRIIGVMNIETTIPDAYTTDDLMLMESVANLLAVAIHNNQLNLQVQKHVEELEERVRERTAHLQEINERLDREIQEKNKAEAEKNKTIDRLNKALEEVRTLKEMLPICSSCKKIRNDQGYWKQIDIYLAEQADVTFSHGICPACAQELYPDVMDRLDRKKKEK